MIASKIWSLTALVTAASAVDLSTLITFPGIRNIGTGLCLQALGDQQGTIVQTACDSANIQQLWTSHAQSSGSSIYQIESDNSQCMWTRSDSNRKVIEASIVFAGSCVLSTGNGAPSNTQYLAHGAIPGTVSLESRVASTNTGFCLDGGNFQSVQMFPCTGSIYQQWAVAG